MDAPLYNALINYKKIIPYHMPGHKFGRWDDMKNIPLYQLDATEVPGLDHLYEADSVILEAEKKAAKCFGSDHTIFVTNGSTAGILTAMLSSCQEKEEILIARNCHHSVWSGLILGGMNPIYIYPDHQKKYGMIGGVNPKNIERAIQEYPNIKAVMIVSPTYEGCVSDVQAIAKIVHKYDKILIVDEAHGAHFAFHHLFPKSAITCGADIVIQSAHKTLPTLTQTAMIHIKGDRIEKEKIIQNLQMIQTSSPSYVMMGVLDYVRAKLERAEEWHSYIQLLLGFKENLRKQVSKIQLISDQVIGTASIIDMDPTKLILSTQEADITGRQLDEFLRMEHGIQMEASTPRYIIGMSTIADDNQQFQKLLYALKQIEANLKHQNKENNSLEWNNESFVKGYSPREIHFAQKENVDLKYARNRVCAKNIMAYPPGIPIVCIGEVITEKIQKMILSYQNQGIKLLGINQNRKITVANI